MEERKYAVYIDADNKTIEIREFVENLQEFHKFINCDCIDIVFREIGDKVIHIICDDCALLKENPKLSVFSLSNKNKHIFGSVIITGDVDLEGNLIPLTIEEAEDIKNFYWINGFKILIIN